MSVHVRPDDHTWLSIVLPVHNVEDFLPSCLDSILAQRVHSFEVIAVDDGSTDSSGLILRHYAENDSRLRVITQRNSGSGAARNAGLESATGEYVFFVDPDDILPNYSLQTLAMHVNGSPRDLFLLGFESRNMRGRVTHRVDYQNPHTVKDNAELGNIFCRLWRQGGAMAVWSKLYRRTFLRANGLWFSTQRTGQDAEFNCRVYATCELAGLLPGIYYQYRVGRPGSAMNRFNPSRLDDSMRVLDALDSLLMHWGKPLDIADSYCLSVAFQSLLPILRRPFHGRASLSALRCNRRLLARIEEIRLTRGVSTLKDKLKSYVIELFL